ncbi:protein suppressor of sable isoform X2 [Cylas formicarius]|uniref:protein suppressor of sable isoform X2 n=1 Tax=Cylas formicarius TaxID=197179 RepID=UPI002958CC83|nr:protein suppressor of sable isoform X2 [Cylas formicarius]
MFAHGYSTRISCGKLRFSPVFACFVHHKENMRRYDVCIRTRNDFVNNSESNRPADETLPAKTEEEDLEDGEIEDDDEEIPGAVAPDQADQVTPAVPPTTASNPELSPRKAEQATDVVPQGTPADKHAKEARRAARREEKERLREEKQGGHHRHMTEAEKSILHLRKREKMMREREKWEKTHRKDDILADDDFAKHIEKTLATILNKKEKEAAATPSGEEDKVEKRGKKRKKNHDRDKHKKQRRTMNNDSPRSEIDENEVLNMRGGSPGSEMRLPPIGNPQDKPSRSPSKSEESYDSEYSTDDHVRPEDSGSLKAKKKSSRNKRKREHKERNKRDRRQQQQLQQQDLGQPQQQGQKVQLQDSQGVCVFYMQGKCQKSDCPYSHEASPPMKLELCKFYLMDCCAKGENCSYMHSEFPCKFYHTGLQCAQGDDCKFAHGVALSDGLKQILFKHIETAPRDILGGFPRMSREEALNLINLTQKKLQDQYGAATPSDDQTVPKEEPKEIKPPKSEKGRSRPSRWHQDNDSGPSFPLKAFSYGSDQDMRINSNGDIDMRTLPTIPSSSQGTMLGSSQSVSATSSLESNSSLSMERSVSPSRQDVDIRTSTIFSMDVDIRHPSVSRFSQMGDVDIRQIIPKPFDDSSTKDGATKGEPILPNLDLPRSTLDLIARITANQKDHTTAGAPTQSQSVSATDQGEERFDLDDTNINWYSDDDDEDENRLTIKVDEEDKVKEREDEGKEEESEKTEGYPSPGPIEPNDIVGRLGDLSKIDISAEVTKLLNSMNQSRKPDDISTGESETASKPQDPRIAKQEQESSLPRVDPRLTTVSDPRKGARRGSSDSQERAKKSEKVSIYEQGGLDMQAALEIENEDFKSALRPDIDLRNLALPFKGMENYTPATEIDASINSHLPIQWKLAIVEIPRPDYTGLKLSINDAEKTGDPRLRKLFRLSTEEKDSPMSPKASPKASAGVRVDPRLRKTEEKTADSQQLNYSQQLSMLQSSQFYQSLTSNQKLMLNQELASRYDQTGGGGSHDPLLNSLLSSLNIVSSANAPMSVGPALSILATLNKMPGPMMGQPGLLGAAPGIPNLPPDFPINFDPRNGGLLGNAPPPVFGGGFPPIDPGGGGGFNSFGGDDFYPSPNEPHPGGGGFRGRGRGGFRDGRRRGRNFNNNRNQRNFKSGGGRNTRPNRHHSPP